MAQYDVRASLTADARGMASTFKRAAHDARSLGDAIRGTNRMASNMVGQMVALGAATFGLHAVTQTFKGMISSGVKFTSELEKTKIGLQAVIMGVEEVPWEEAGKRGAAAFQKVREMAILSPATSEEMFNIFQGIIGPIESAGFSMNKVLDITNDTVLAASALNVDYQQASRDISMMARGTAGMEVKLFSMLRSTGAIKEDAKEWNAMLPKDRVEKLSAALKKFAGSGKAFGSSWAGVTSTFKDLIDNFKASAMSPVMRVIGRNLEAFNGYVIQHRTELENFFDGVGMTVGSRIGALFDRAREGFTWVLTNWGTIVERFDHVVSKTKEIAPIIAKAAIAWQGVQLGRQVVGGGLQMGGAAADLLGGAGGIMGGMFAGRAAGASAAGGGLTRAMQMGGVGGGFTGIEGGFTEAMLASSASGGGGAAAAGMGTAGVLIALAAALAAVAAIVLTVKEYWTQFTTIFAETGLQIGKMFMGLGMSIWKFLAPILKIVGSLIMGVLTPAWIIFSTLLRGLMFVLTPLFELLGFITNAIWNSVKPAFDFLFNVLEKVASFMTQVFSDLAEQSESAKRADELRRLRSQEGLPTAPADTDWSRWHPISQGKAPVDLDKVPKSAMNVTNDFRGSRISVKQDFKGDADPDRIVMAMVHDLTRQAESRISSGFSGALTR